MRKLSFFTLLLVATICLTNTKISFAMSHPRQAVSAVTALWPPFRLKETDNRISGIDIDILNELGRRVGFDYSVKILPWARCLLQMKEGQSDIMTGIAKTADRAKYILYSGIPYYTCRPAFYSLKERTIHIEKYVDLQKKTIGYARKSAYFKQFDEDQKLNKYPVNSEEQLIRILLAGRVDTIIGTDCQVEYDLNVLNLTNKIQKQSFKPDDSILLYIGISRKSPFVNKMPAINTALQEMLKDGTIDRITAHYLPQ